MTQQNDAQVLRQLSAEMAIDAVVADAIEAERAAIAARVKDYAETLGGSKDRRGHQVAMAVYEDITP